jgi:hypothetical protein
VIGASFCFGIVRIDPGIHPWTPPDRHQDRHQASGRGQLRHGEPPDRRLAFLSGHSA